MKKAESQKKVWQKPMIKKELTIKETLGKAVSSVDGGCMDGTCGS